MQYIQPKVADQDIPVFKVVRKDEQGRYTPYYYSNDYEYREGLHKMDFDIHADCVEDTDANGKRCVLFYEIHKGFHSYNAEKVELQDNFTDWGAESIEYVKLLDWYQKKSLYTDLCKMNCFIPKGATYYENKYGEIVSNMLNVLSFDVLSLRLTFNKYKYNR